MKNNNLKKQLHDAIDRVDDEKMLHEIKFMVDEAIAASNNESFRLSEVQWEEIDRRRENYLSGKDKLISHSQFLQKMRKAIQ